MSSFHTHNGRTMKMCNIWHFFKWLSGNQTGLICVLDEELSYSPDSPEA